MEGKEQLTAFRRRDIVFAFIGFGGFFSEQFNNKHHGRDDLPNISRSGRWTWEK